MAILKVIFPHYDDEGNWFHAGDYREVPTDHVDFYLKHDIRLGIKVMAIDTDVWNPEASVNPPLAELGLVEDTELRPPVPAEDMVEASEPEAEESGAEQEEVTEEAPDEAPKPVKKSKK